MLTRRLNLYGGISILKTRSYFLVYSILCRVITLTVDFFVGDICKLCSGRLFFLFSLLFIPTAHILLERERKVL